MRFFEKVDKGSEFDACWIWKGAIDEDGYGKFRMPDKSVKGTHIISWELANNRTVPKGWHVDHLCRIRACCNPDHLEAVEHSENVRRGTSFAAKNAAKTHCPRGHEFTAENTRWHHNSRECITCIRQRDRQRRQAQRAEREFDSARGD
ncbi:HNH endonuclease signature motif containing protein [Kitasatospora sp. NPDC052896]|uniref:HNH endonuclease signature motif containing protein n=1 Tax=Kitasatospora sp. NPDC052896 TaxID=3364061 RepID=UPI0037CB398F